MLFVRFIHDTRKAKRQLLNRPAAVGEVAALVAARCAQVLGAFVPLRQAQGRLLAFDEPQAQPLKVARREFVEGQSVGCPGDGGLGHWPLAVSG